jgi:hypothetical protein
VLVVNGQIPEAPEGVLDLEAGLVLKEEDRDLAQEAEMKEVEEEIMVEDKGSLILIICLLEDLVNTQAKTIYIKSFANLGDVS